MIQDPQEVLPSFQWLSSIQDPKVRVWVAKRSNFPTTNGTETIQKRQDQFPMKHKKQAKMSIPIRTAQPVFHPKNSGDICM